MIKRLLDWIETLAIAEQSNVVVATIVPTFLIHHRTANCLASNPTHRESAIGSTDAECDALNGFPARTKEIAGWTFEAPSTHATQLAPTSPSRSRQQRR